MSKLEWARWQPSQQCFDSTEGFQWSVVIKALLDMPGLWVRVTSKRLEGEIAMNAIAFLK